MVVNTPIGLAKNCAVSTAIVSSENVPPKSLPSNKSLNSAIRSAGLFNSVSHTVSFTLLPAFGISTNSTVTFVTSHTGGSPSGLSFPVK